MSKFTPRLSILRYTGPAYASRLVILFADLVMAFIAIHAASLLRLNFDIAGTFELFDPVVLLVMIVRISSFRWFRTYAVIVRFVGARDLIQVIAAVTGGSLFLLGLSILLRPNGVSISMSILAIDYFLLITMMCGTRLCMPVLYRFIFQPDGDFHNVIIIGAGQLGAMTRNVITQDIQNNYRIIGIMDDNPSIDKKNLDGIPVFAPSRLSKVLEEDRIDKAIFAIQNISATRKSELVDLCLANNIKVSQVPYRSEWLQDEFKLGEIKEIEIEDLLDRAAIALDKDNLDREYKDHVVLITGGAGSIGSELIRQLIPLKPSTVIIIDQAETPLVNLGLECIEKFNFPDVIPVIADVTDELRMNQIFEEYHPRIVFHAAAYKHVPIMEEYPREAVSVNIRGTKLIADLCGKYGVDKFVMVSTDKAVNPTNVMGASKRIAEMYIQSLNNQSKTKFITTRFGNVLGSNGSVVPRFKKQINSGGPVTVTHPDITRYFMTIPEASLLVLEAGAMGRGGEIYLFDMGQPVKIVDLASRMIKLSGYNLDEIKVQFTGLRPGEKLMEELLSNKEDSIETHHPKITRARTRKYEFSLINEEISSLINNIDQETDIGIVQRMKKLVPEFISNNSVFGIIDKENTLSP